MERKDGRTIDFGIDSFWDRGWDTTRNVYPPFREETRERDAKNRLVRHEPEEHYYSLIVVDRLHSFVRAVLFNDKDHFFGIHSAKLIYILIAIFALLIINSFIVFSE